MARLFQIKFQCYYFLTGILIFSKKTFLHTFSIITLLGTYSIYLTRIDK